MDKTDEIIKILEDYGIINNRWGDRLAVLAAAEDIIKLFEDDSPTNIHPFPKKD